MCSRLERRCLWIVTSRYVQDGKSTVWGHKKVPFRNRNTIARLFFKTQFVYDKSVLVHNYRYNMIVKQVHALLFAFVPRTFRVEHAATVQDESLVYS